MKDMAGFQSLRSSLQSYSRFFVSSWPSIQSPVLLVNFFTKGSESFSLDHIFPILEAIDSHATVSLEGKQSLCGHPFPFSQLNLTSSSPPH